MKIIKKNINFLLTKQLKSISIKSTNSILGELVASITLANPFLFFLETALRGCSLLDKKLRSYVVEFITSFLYIFFMLK